MTTYPKRLIEVDLPIARISAHARREKSIRPRPHLDSPHLVGASTVAGVPRRALRVTLA